MPCEGEELGYKYKDAAFGKFSNSKRNKEEKDVSKIRQLYGRFARSLYIHKGQRSDTASHEICESTTLHTPPGEKKEPAIAERVHPHPVWPPRGLQSSISAKRTPPAHPIAGLDAHQGTISSHLINNIREIHDPSHQITLLHSIKNELTQRSTLTTGRHWKAEYDRFIGDIGTHHRYDKKKSSYHTQTIGSRQKTNPARKDIRSFFDEKVAFGPEIHPINNASAAFDPNNNSHCLLKGAHSPAENLSLFNHSPPTILGYSPILPPRPPTIPPLSVSKEQPKADDAAHNSLFMSRFPYVSSSLRKRITVTDLIRKLHLNIIIFLVLLGILCSLFSIAIQEFGKLLDNLRLFLLDLNHESGNFKGSEFAIYYAVSLLYILVPFSIVKLVPLGAGGGIPEVKTVLSDQRLKNFLSLKTGIAKGVSLGFSLVSGVFVGKEGPYIHVSACLAEQLMRRVPQFAHWSRRRSLMQQMYAAAASVGVSSTFATPLGGLLFSIEVTSIYYLLETYFYAFIATSIAALTRQMIFGRVHQNSEFGSISYDRYESAYFVLIGLTCGLLGALFSKMLKYHIRFIRSLEAFFIRTLRIGTHAFSLIQLIIVFSICISFTYYIGSFSRYTSLQFMSMNLFTIKDLCTASSIIEQSSDPQIRSSLPSLLVNEKNWCANGLPMTANLSLFALGSWLLSLTSQTLALPTGMFTPGMIIGAIIGRLTGILAQHLSKSATINIGAYSMVGASAFLSGITHTISCSVIMLEVSGQWGFLYPSLLTSLLAYLVSKSLSTSIYDVVLTAKKMPYLPYFRFENVDYKAYHVLDPNIISIERNTTLFEIAFLLKKTKNMGLRLIEIFPIIESKESPYLLGSVSRHALDDYVSYKLTALGFSEYKRNLMAGTLISLIRQNLMSPVGLCIVASASNSANNGDVSSGSKPPISNNESTDNTANNNYKPLVKHITTILETDGGAQTPSDNLISKKNQPRITSSDGYFDFDEEESAPTIIKERPADSIESGSFLLQRKKKRSFIVLNSPAILPQVHVDDEHVETLIPTTKRPARLKVFHAPKFAQYSADSFINNSGVNIGSEMASIDMQPTPPPALKKAGRFAISKPNISNPGLVGGTDQKNPLVSAPLITPVPIAATATPAATVVATANNRFQPQEPHIHSTRLLPPQHHNQQFHGNLLHGQNEHQFTPSNANCLTTKPSTPIASNQTKLHTIKNKIYAPAGRSVEQISPDAFNLLLHAKLDLFKDPTLLVDHSPFQIIQQASVSEVHFLFTMLKLKYLFVTSFGEFVGIITRDSIIDAAKSLASQKRKASKLKDTHDTTVHSTLEENTPSSPCANPIEEK